MAQERRLHGATPAAPRPSGRFFYRADHNDYRFLEEYDGGFGGVILTGGHLAPSRNRRTGTLEPRDELRVALRGRGRRPLIDPDLVALTVERPPRNAANMPHAQILDLPLTQMQLALPDNVERLVDETIAFQHGTEALCAPYLTFDCAGSAGLGKTLEMVRLTARKEPDETIVAVVQAPVEALVAGTVAATAADFRRAGADWALVRIAGFDPDEASTNEIAAYLHCVGAFGAAGVDAIADCTGRFGAALVAHGALGYASGAVNYQQVPRNPIFTEFELGLGRKLMYERADMFVALPPKHARAAHAMGQLPACPEGECTALEQSAQNRALRAHVVHLFQHRAVWAAQCGPVKVGQALAGGRNSQSRRWGAALLDANRSAATP